MILVDTSVFIDHFRGLASAAGLAWLLEEGLVALHPFVLGELVALGHLGPRRARVLSDLKLLPAASVVADDEVLQMIELRRLAGSGIGWIDAHLLASALAGGMDLWTSEQHLRHACARLGVRAPRES